MRIAFVALSAAGHLNPTTALARQLQSRNHEVVVISLPDAEPYVSDPSGQPLKRPEHKKTQQQLTRKGFHE